MESFDSGLKWNHVTHKYKLNMITECYPLVSVWLITYRNVDIQDQHLLVQTTEYNWNNGMRYHEGKTINLLEIGYNIWCGKLVPAKNIIFSRPCSLVCVVLLCINLPHT